jgi:hypothetical protein
MPGLDNNPADGALFSKTHPYFAERYAGGKEACKAVIRHSPGVNYRYVSEDFPKGYRAGGKLYVSTQPGVLKKLGQWNKKEEDKYQRNLAAAKELAKWGEKLCVLPELKDTGLRELFLKGVKVGKNPDFLIKVEGAIEYLELKQPDSYKRGAGVISDLVRGAGNQADKVVLFLEKDKIAKHDVMRALKGRVLIKENINEIWLLWKNYGVEKYSRDEILKYFGP